MPSLQEKRKSGEDGGNPVTVNPVWIPAFGDETTPTAYRFLDQSAKPGVSYVYTVQGITTDGLVSESDGVAIRPGVKRPR